MNAFEIAALDINDLELVTGGATKATYGNMCVRGAGDGALQGLAGGAGMLPFAALSGPVSPLTAGVMVGGGTAIGAAAGCAQGMWELYKQRNPIEP